MGEQGQGECTEVSLWGPVGFLVSVSVSVSEWKSLSHVRLFATPWKVAHQALCPWDSPGKNTGVVCIPFSRGFMEEVIIAALSSLKIWSVAEFTDKDKSVAKWMTLPQPKQKVELKKSDAKECMLWNATK